MTVDYTPVPFVNEFDLQPGMSVTPYDREGRVVDERRWRVERVSGAFTRCIVGGAEGLADKFTSQYWATDSLRPAPAKVASPMLAPGKPRQARPAGDLDSVAQALRDCHGLDALLAYAASRGYPDCDDLRAKISHLNPGLQRMNVGNRLRRFLGSA